MIFPISLLHFQYTCPCIRVSVCTRIYACDVYLYIHIIIHVVFVSVYSNSVYVYVYLVVHTCVCCRSGICVDVYDRHTHSYVYVYEYACMCMYVCDTCLNVSTFLYIIMINISCADFANIF